MDDNQHVVSLDPKIGFLRVKPTQIDHIYTEAGDAEAPFVTVRGVEITGSIHMYLWADGKWHCGPEYKDEYGKRVKTSTYEQRHHAWFKRRDWLSRRSGQDEPSNSARDLIMSLVTTRVNAWALSHQQDLNRAEVANLTTQVERQAADVRALQEKLSLEQTALYELQKRLAGAQQMLRNGAKTVKV